MTAFPTLGENRTVHIYIYIYIYITVTKKRQ